MTDDVGERQETNAAASEMPLPPDGGGKRRPRRDFFGALFLLALAAAFIAQALRMPFKDPAWQWYTAPNAFPLAMAVCLALCAVFVGVRGLIGWHRERANIAPIRWVEDARAWGVGRFIAGAAMIALLIALLGRVNFYWLAGGAIVAFALVFRSDPLSHAFKSGLIAALSIVAFLYGIGRVFGIVFP